MNDEGLTGRGIFRIGLALVLLVIAVVATGHAMMIEPETAMHQIY